MVGLASLVTAISIVGEVFSRSLVLDLVSFWPGLILVMLVAAALYPFHRGKWSRLAAVVPLLILSWLGSTIALHLTEWSALPSSAADFEGPAGTGLEHASMIVATGGDLSLEFEESDVLYSVKLARTGGATPAARSFERIEAPAAQISISERGTDDTWFLTDGWRLSLAPMVSWDLDLEAASMVADLRGASISFLRLAGSGDVSLPKPSGSVAVAVEGRFEVSLPVGVSMAVTGTDVSVPDSWASGEGEWTSPGTGDGYRVTVTSGGSLVVKDE